MKLKIKNLDNGKYVLMDTESELYLHYTAKDGWYWSGYKGCIRYTSKRGAECQKAIQESHHKLLMGLR